MPLRNPLGTVSPAVNNGYGNLISDIAVLVAFYYGATGLACAWAFRHVMFASGRFFLTGVLLPFLSGAFCFWVGYQVIRQSGLSGSAPILVAIGLGVPLVFVHQWATRSHFFNRPVVALDAIGASD